MVLPIPQTRRDAATALSGVCPACVCYQAAARVDAGILLGIPRSAALEMLIQSVCGAATIVRESGENPGLLREAVTCE